MSPRMDGLKSAWPELPYAAWKDTYATLHLWTQMVGKIRLVQTPWLNHSWHVVLYVSPRGLTTSAIPYGDRTFQLDYGSSGQADLRPSILGDIGGLPCIGAKRARSRRAGSWHRIWAKAGTVMGRQPATVAST